MKIAHCLFNSLATLLVTAMVLVSCQLAERSRLTAIVWKDNKAVGLTIPKELVMDTSIQQLKVRLVKEGERSPVLGEFVEGKDGFHFTPLVPLTLGLNYEVMAGEIVVSEIAIPKSDSSAPELLAIYPSQDTVPENLLKVYLNFSQPMAEGRSANYVHLLKNDRDTMQGTFLDLQPELWNEDGTVLTLWLDPGRIKLDLMPNKELGNPLKEGESYTLHVAAGWKSKEGNSLAHPGAKSFFVSFRDNVSPDPEMWRISVPKSGTSLPFEVDFREPIDRMLCSSAIHVLDMDGRPVSGTIQVLDEDRIFKYSPLEAWKVGHYDIQVEARLEDLAGNNLNRLFEKDLLKKGRVKEDATVSMLGFDIR